MKNYKTVRHTLFDSYGRFIKSIRDKRNICTSSPIRVFRLTLAL